MNRFCVGLSLIIVQLLGSNSVFGQNKVSNQTGGWSNPAIWTPTGVPTATDNVLVSNGHTVSIGASGTCSNLTIGSGALAVLQFTGNTALTMTIGGDITVSSAASFSVRTNSNATHSIMVSGNVVNQGSFSMRTDANSLCNVSFLKNGNQTISGSGTTTQFNRITLGMGGSINNVLEVTSTTFSTGSNFLILNGGTFKLSSPAATTLVPFTAATTVAANSRLWLNTASAVLSCSAGITLSGVMQVSSGTLSVGNANNEDLTPTGGTLSISGGSVVIAGKLNVSSTASTFSMTGGILRISNNASTNTSIAPFNITAAGSTFVMSDGTIVLRREGGSGAQDLGYVNTGSGSGAVTGGTLQLGDATSPAAQNIRINSSYPLPNLVINSGSVTGILNTNSLNVVGGISILSGTLSANNLNISLGGNWSSAGTFSPGTANVTFSSASSQTITRTGGETFRNLLFGGSGTKTFGAPVTTTGNFSISSGSTVDVSASNYSLTVAGNFVNNGSFVQRNGTVLFNGTSSQSITGTNASSFYDITLNNTAGAVLGNDINFEGTLQLNNGTLNVNSKTLTLISNSLVTARVGSIAGTGNISGNMTVQRYVPGGYTGWAFWGSPLSSALTFSDWDDDIYISCPTCPDGYVPGFTSIYSYDETVTGSYSNTSSYVSISSVSSPISAGSGYWVYVGNGPVNTTSIVTDVTGTIQKFNYAITLHYTNTGSASDDGWNLICNPYPSAISWASLKGTTANIDNAVYVYNADLNAGLGGYATYVNGVSSPATSSGGIDDNIPMGQGFFVHSTGATSLQATESIKVNSNPGLLKPSTAPPSQLLRLTLKTINVNADETVLYYESNATQFFEKDYDAIKLGSDNPNAPLISIAQGSADYQVNGVAPVSGSFSIPVRVTSAISGSFVINALGTETFPMGACITLYDRVTHTTTDLRTSSYAFNLVDTTQAPRFELHITNNPLNVNALVTQPTCDNTANGSIAAGGFGNGPWNYIWKQNGNTIKTSMNMMGSDTLKNLSGGNYELEVNTVGQCNNHSSTYFITPQTPVTAAFSSNDTLWLSTGNNMQFSNMSLNAVAQTWHSGNNVTSNAYNPGFAYTAPGNYMVSLICLSSTGCSDTASKKIVVIDDLTGLSSNNNPTFRLKNNGNNLFQLEGEILNPGDEVMVRDLTGKVIKTQTLQQSGIAQIDLSAFPKGVYVATILNKGYNKITIKLMTE